VNLRAGERRTPTDRWLALTEHSLHAIAEHCKRYEVTIAAYSRDLGSRQLDDWHCAILDLDLAGARSTRIPPPVYIS
jgi:hypothetical protein